MAYADLMDMNVSKLSGVGDGQRSLAAAVHGFAELDTY